MADERGEGLARQRREHLDLLGGFGFRLDDLRFNVSGLGFSVSDSGLEIHDLAFPV